MYIEMAKKKSPMHVFEDTKLFHFDMFSQKGTTLEISTPPMGNSG